MGNGGGQPRARRLAANLTALLVAQLQGKPCRVFSSDLRVRVQATGLATYPDVTVICGHLTSDPQDRRGHTALNPKVVFEVLSPSTEDYDRGEKLLHYRQAPSIEEIVLIAQDRRAVEVFRRGSEGFEQIVVTQGKCELTSIACELSLDDLYRNPLAT